MINLNYIAEEIDKDNFSDDLMIILNYVIELFIAGKSSCILNRYLYELFPTKKTEVVHLMVDWFIKRGVLKREYIWVDNDEEVDFSDWVNIEYEIDMEEDEILQCIKEDRMMHPRNGVMFRNLSDRIFSYYKILELDYENYVDYKLMIAKKKFEYCCKLQITIQEMDEKLYSAKEEFRKMFHNLSTREEKRKFSEYVQQSFCNETIVDFLHDVGSSWNDENKD